MIKSRLIQDVNIEAFDTQDFDKDEDYKNIMKEFLQAHNEYTFEDKPRKPRKKKGSPLTDFITEVDTDVTPDESLNIEELLDGQDSDIR